MCLVALFYTSLSIYDIRKLLFWSYLFHILLETSFRVSCYGNYKETHHLHVKCSSYLLSLVVLLLFTSLDSLLLLMNYRLGQKTFHWFLTKECYILDKLKMFFLLTFSIPSCFVFVSGIQWLYWVCGTVASESVDSVSSRRLHNLSKVILFLAMDFNS